MTTAWRIACDCQTLQRDGLCDSLGHPPGVVAIAWLLHQPGVTSAIVGPRRRDQFASLLKAPDLILEDAVLSRLDAIFPPCGPAPEAYAW